jgi:hypothetical protein
VTDQVSHPYKIYDMPIYQDGPGSSVGIATGYGLEGLGLNPGGGEVIRTCPDRPWGPHSLLNNGYRVWDNDQLDTHLLYFTIRLLNPLHVSSIMCSSPGGWIVFMQHLVSSSQSVVVRRTGWERTALQFSLNLCAGRPLPESDDTRCCINTIQPPDDEHIMLQTCRGL